MEYEISKIDEQTWVLSEGFVRFFLIAGEKEALLLDTGMNVGKALEAARSLTLLPVRLINTHADPDHIGGNKDFSEVMMHAAEEENYVQHGSGGGCTKIFPVSEGRLLILGNVLFRLSGFRVILRAALGFLILSADIFSAGIWCSRVVRSLCLVLRGTLLSLLSLSKNLRRCLTSLI